MTAYGLADRFPRTPPCFRIHDPGAYSTRVNDVNKPNKQPFLSNTPRDTGRCNKIYTEKIYDAGIPHKIQNITSLKSKKPRFPYEAFGKEDLERLLCQCGIAVCECPVDDQPEDGECQAKVRRRLFKGPPPHSHLGTGISSPSKRHGGYDIFDDGSAKPITRDVDDCPPFYDTRVHESTEFYHGWKWSKWTSNRSVKKSDSGLGPAYYDVLKKPTEYELCMEKVREYKRKTSKQLRYIEMVQNKNILEGSPGPSDYRPALPKGTDLENTVAKAERFPLSQYDMRPGPTTYNIKRAFDLPEEHSCRAKLPQPAPFGFNAKRFSYIDQGGPGPAAYVPKSKICNILNCPTGAGFNSSAPRFKPTPIPDDDNETPVEDDDESDQQKVCPKLTWGFRSRTIRIKPLEKKYDVPSPADIVLNKYIPRRTPLIQYLAPFNSSEGRFQPWNNWLSVFQRLKTPGPCYYSLKKPQCPPAVSQGPVYRAKRFQQPSFMTPAPNEYKIRCSTKTVLATHNHRLENNVKNLQKKHVWEPPSWPRLNYEERETAILNNIIDILDENHTGEKKKIKKIRDVSGIKIHIRPVKVSKSAEKFSDEHPKLLKTFLYRHDMPHYF